MFRDILNTLADHLHEHATKILTALLLMAAGWILGNWRARRNWKTRSFLDRLNFSLNTISDGVLLIRTLSEMPCEEVFLNKVAADRATEAARNTTVTAPLLPLPQEDYWYYLNGVLNQLSEQFALGHLKRNLGCEVKSAVYVICLTCEAAGEVRTRKQRAMVIQKSLLTNFPKETPQFESPNHITRWETLKQLAAEYPKHPWKFLTVELSV